MKNKHVIIISIIFSFLLSFLIVLFYPTTFVCGKGNKKIEKKFFTLNIYDSKENKDAICKRESILEPFYSCKFTFHDKQINNILVKHNYLYVLLELKNISYEQAVDICDGSVMIKNDRVYCIIYSCGRKEQ